jgi:hypothetical protein
MHSSLGQSLKLATRRQLFQTCGIGLGKAALASMIAQELGSTPLQAADREPRGHHHQPRIKRVIYLFMAGAPSQLDLFDHKPKLTELEGKPIPPSVIAGQRYAFIQPNAAVLAPRFKFARHGESGAEFSEIMPHLATVADDLAIIKTVHTDQFNHSQSNPWPTGHGFMVELRNWQ